MPLTLEGHALNKCHDAKGKIIYEIQTEKVHAVHGLFPLVYVIIYPCNDIRYHNFFIRFIK
jgi:hypothetical protein